MNTTKIIQKLSVALVVFMATAMFNNVTAQKYGGSAYVHVKDTRDGKTRVLTATAYCDESSESDAKSDLESQLKNARIIYEEFDSQIYYSIDRCDDDDQKKYGGSASVKVKDTRNGKTRVLTATAYCDESNKSYVKKDLEKQLKNARIIYEEFIEGISYDIDSCN